MRINSQLPLIYDPNRRYAQSVEGAVDQTTQPQPERGQATQKVQPTAWVEGLDWARNYTLKAQQLDQAAATPRGREAISAYTHNEHVQERDYLTTVLGIDTYA